MENVFVVALQILLCVFYEMNHHQICFYVVTFCPLWIIKCNQYSNIEGPIVLLSHKIRASKTFTHSGIISYHYSIKEYTLRIIIISVPRSRVPMNQTAWTITLAIIFNNSINPCQGMSTMVITIFTNSFPRN